MIISGYIVLTNSSKRRKIRVTLIKNITQKWFLFSVKEKSQSYHQSYQSSFIIRHPVYIARFSHGNRRMGTTSRKTKESGERRFDTSSRYRYAGSTRSVFRWLRRGAPLDSSLSLSLRVTITQGTTAAGVCLPIGDRHTIDCDHHTVFVPRIYFQSIDFSNRL